ncbi:MAG: alkene reductase, partial [Aeromonas sp.]
MVIQNNLAFLCKNALNARSRITRLGYPIMNSLFQPYRLNDSLTLANRFMMAPLTRCMA